MLASQAAERAGPECKLHEDDVPILYYGYTVGAQQICIEWIIVQVNRGIGSSDCSQKTK